MFLEEVPLLFASQKIFFLTKEEEDKEIEKEMRSVHVIKYLYISNLVSK